MDIALNGESVLFAISAFSYINIVALTLITYDTLITLEDEITLIWKRKFGLVSTLYLLARYFSIVQSSITAFISTLEPTLIISGGQLMSPIQNISQILSELGDVLPPILLCRFMLQLRKFNSRVQTVPSIHIASTYRGIRGQLSRLNETIIEEFGNPRLDFALEEERDMAELVPGEDYILSADIDTEVCITTEEFPWAVNSV
ncbi:hypothetical protein M422DRAFT_244314 [Sphaerobolus stellatus SS14]|nr:hypothetical protein M422DRAFT_244314 [Sphaerobolus stellatus SS14]